jgi:hypothetical protein
VQQYLSIFWRALVVFVVDLWAEVCILLQPDDFHRLARLPTSRGWSGCKNSRPDTYLGAVGTHKDFFRIQQHWEPGTSGLRTF